MDEQDQITRLRRSNLELLDILMEMLQSFFQEYPAPEACLFWVK